MSPRRPRSSGQGGHSPIAGAPCIRLNSTHPVQPKPLGRLEGVTGAHRKERSGTTPTSTEWGAPEAGESCSLDRPTSQENARLPKERLPWQPWDPTRQPLF